MMLYIDIIDILYFYDDQVWLQKIQKERDIFCTGRKDWHVKTAMACCFVHAIAFISAVSGLLDSCVGVVIKFLQ